MKQRKFKEYQFNIKIVRACLQCFKEPQKIFQGNFQFDFIEKCFIKID